MTWMKLTANLLFLLASLSFTYTVLLSSRFSETNHSFKKLNFDKLNSSLKSARVMGNVLMTAQNLEIKTGKLTFFWKRWSWNLTSPAVEAIPFAEPVSNPFAFEVSPKFYTHQNWLTLKIKKHQICEQFVINLTLALVDKPEA